MSSHDAKQYAKAPARQPRKWLRSAAVLAFVVTSAFAWSRVGMLDLPAAPGGLTLADTGLADLATLKATDDFLRAGASRDTLEAAGVAAPSVAAAEMVRNGRTAIHAGDAPGGLEMMRAGVRQDPTNLALSNAFRITVFELQRRFLTQAYTGAVLTPTFPPHLDGEPMVFFESLLGDGASREIRLQLALAWVDRMLLFPALEIKAPSSVEAVKILTSLLDEGNAGFVPALFARGLNHLHRPARLVWPESRATPPDAASQDIGACVAIGRKFGAGSSRLQATLAVTLGDAYVKAGRLGVARSWWQIAQNLSDDTGLQEAIRRRYGWHDQDALDQLEKDLDRARSALDEPMTDLALMWN